MFDTCVFFCTESTTYPTNPKVQCIVNEDCPYTEACIDNVCHPPCNVRNPCAEHAVCVNINHGSDCKCQDGFHGNGYVGCQQGRVTFLSHSLCQSKECCLKKL